MNNFHDLGLGIPEYKRDANLFKETGGLGGINNNVGKITHIDKDKNRFMNFNNSGNNFSKVNSNNTSNIIPNSKNNFNDSNTESVINFENRSNSHVMINLCF